MEQESKKIEFTSENVSLYVQPYMNGPIRRLAPKMQRNDLCPVNDVKFKKCCGQDGSNFCKKMLSDYLNELQEAQNKLKNDQSG